MITSSYSEQEQYTQSVEQDFSPRITTSSIIPRDKAKYTLKPGDPEDLYTQSNGNYGYVEGHSREDQRELGWTQKEYTSSLEAGGMVRNAILSGSYGELKKLRVDSEVNSETATTSWSASIGENLRVGRNAGVAGYLNLGDTASLVTSDQKGVSPQPDFAPNSEGITGSVEGESDLRLVVSNSALIQDRLYVGKSASISGGLDVKEDVRIARNLFVTGNTQMTGTLRVVDRTYLTGSVQIVGNEAVTGSVHVSKSIYGSENFYLTGNAEVTGTLKVVNNTYLSGNVQVVGNEAVTGSLHVSKSIYGSENFYLTGNAEVTGTLRVVGKTYLTGAVQLADSMSVSGSVNIRQDLFVTGDASVTGALNVSGNAYFHSNSFFDHSASILDLTVENDARIENNLGVTGDEYLSGSLYVKQDAVITRSLYVNGETFMTGNVHADSDLMVAGETIVSGNAEISKSLAVSGNVAVTGSTHISGNLYVSGATILTSSLDVVGPTTFHGETTYEGDAHFLESVVIEKNLTVHGTTTTLDTEELKVKDKSITIAMSASTPAQANGAGIDIAGADVHFHYTSSTDRMGLNKGLDILGDENVSGSLHVSESIYGSENFYLTGNAAITGNLGVRGDVDIESSHFMMSGAQIIDGTASIDHSLTVPYLRVGTSASIELERVTQSYVDNSIITHSLVLTQSVSQSAILSSSISQSYVQNEIVTQSLVLTQSVSQSTVLSQSVTTQSVNLQHVNSSSVEQLNVLSGSVQDIQIVSGNAEYIKVEKLEVTSTEPAEFHGDVIVEGNVSGSQSGSFRDLYVENNATIGNTASVDHFLEITNNDGEGNSVVINTGSIDAHNSDAFFQNISASGNVTASVVSASCFYGYGGGLIGITASAASSSTWKSYIDFEAGTTQSVTHPFNTTDVFVQVYKWNDPNFHPDLNNRSSFDGISGSTRVNDATVKVVGNGVVEISYDSAINGYAVISDAGMIITASVDLLQVAADSASFEVPAGNEKTIYRFEHKLGTKNLIVNVYQYADVKDGYGTVMPVQIFPEQVAIPDNSHIDIVFGRANIRGYIVLGKAGHVIKTFDILDFIDDYNIHYGTEGDWTANSFAATTMSSDIVYAGEYVDTARVGNRDTNTHYYYASCSWGSYTEYTDIGINEYVRYSRDDDADIWQVSNIDKDGNLTIRGALISNGTFNTSDIRKKNVTGKVENALEDIKKINGVRFNWKDSGEPSIGVIAQEINAIYPELTKVVPDLNNQEQMVVNYEGIIGVLVEAIKELSYKVESLEDRIRNENR